MTTAATMTVVETATTIAGETATTGGEEEEEYVENSCESVLQVDLYKRA